MIITVSDRDVERDSPKQLFEIGTDVTLGAARVQELGKLVPSL